MIRSDVIMVSLVASVLGFLSFIWGGDVKPFKEWAWPTATAAAVIAPIMLFVCSWDLPVEKSNSVASWVQAIGSVAAIYGAYAIGRQQIHHDKEMAKQAAENAAAALRSVVKAVVDDVYQQLLDVGWLFNHEVQERSVTPMPFLSMGLHFHEPTYQASVRRLEAVPVFELGTEDLAKAVISFQDVATQLSRWLEFARRIAFGPTTEEEKRIPDEAVRQQIHALLQDAEEIYRLIVAETGGSLLADARPMRAAFGRH